MALVMLGPTPTRNTRQHGSAFPPYGDARLRRQAGQTASHRGIIPESIAKFYDSELKSVRRYFPDVGEDKDANAMDSWYLYHPLLNLAYPTLAGDKPAKEFLLKAVGSGIKVVLN